MPAPGARPPVLGASEWLSGPATERRHRSPRTGGHDEFPESNACQYRDGNRTPRPARARLCRPTRIIGGDGLRTPRRHGAMLGRYQSAGAYVQQMACIVPRTALMPRKPMTCPPCCAALLRAEDANQRAILTHAETRRWLAELGLTRRTRLPRATGRDTGRQR